MSVFDRLLLKRITACPPAIPSRFSAKAACVLQKIAHWIYHPSVDWLGTRLVYPIPLAP